MTPSYKYKDVLGVHRIGPIYNQNTGNMMYGSSDLSWFTRRRNKVNAILANITFSRQSRPLKGL